MNDHTVGDNHIRKSWYLENFKDASVIVELGVATGHTSKIFMECATEKVYGIDIVTPPLRELYSYAWNNRVDYEFIHASTLDVPPIYCDILFVDSHHAEDHVYKELIHFSPLVREMIAIHDTSPILRMKDAKLFGADLAVKRFLDEDDAWDVYYQDHLVCGLTVLKRVCNE